MVSARRGSRGGAPRWATIAAAAVLGASLSACVSSSDGPDDLTGPDGLTGPNGEPSPTGGTPSADPSDSEAAAPHGFAAVSAPGAHTEIPGEGWWTTTGIDETYEREHPDTLLVAGWADELVEGYRRDPGSGDVTIVAANAFGPVPIDPLWPDAWLIIDAHTFEVIEVLWAPGDSGGEWVVPEGFTEVTGADAERFLALSPPWANLVTTVHGDGDLVGVRAVDVNGFGYMLRFDDTDPEVWPQGPGEEPFALDGFAASASGGRDFADWHFTATSDAGDCAFTISAVVPPDGGTPPGEMPEVLVNVLPRQVAELCP